MAEIPLLDHQLADDEVKWVRGVYADFARTRADFANPKDALREVLGRTEHALKSPIELSGDGPWRNGRNNHDRTVACVFLKKVELHRHSRSRTDQFPMYVVGEADGFALEGDQPMLIPVASGGHFHNAPDAPHAFVPKVGRPINEDWEIAFIAITPRNLKEDTQAVTDDTRAAYQRVTGYEAPAGV
jgi:hypothetical protein